MTRMPITNPLRLTLGLLAVCCCASVFAQPSAQPRAQSSQAAGPSWLGDLDTDHDGRISEQEAAAMPVIAKQFALLDLNHDGYLTMSEVQAFWRQLEAQSARSGEAGRMAAFEKADKNHDGKLSLEEAKAGMPRVAINFKTLDTNKDGILSKEEVAAGGQMAAQSRIAQKRRAEGQLFTKADSNHDGKLSLAEFTAAFPRLARSFAFFDENHDGFVEPTEFALPPR